MNPENSAQPTFLESKRRDDLLAGEELLKAARSLAALLMGHNAVALPISSTGERLLGAALTMDPRLGVMDPSQRCD